MLNLICCQIYIYTSVLLINDSFYKYVLLDGYNFWTHHEMFFHKCSDILKCILCFVVKSCICLLFIKWIYDDDVRHCVFPFSCCIFSAILRVILHN